MTRGPPIFEDIQSVILIIKIIYKTFLNKYLSKQLKVWFLNKIWLDFPFCIAKEVSVRI